MLTLRRLAASAFAIFVLAGTVGASETQTVVIDNFSFKPNALTVHAGAHVVFRNQDDLPHSVVVPGLQKRSSLLDTDQSYDLVFDKPGKYQYFCGIHPMMTGVVTVVAE
jgi:plastocyanin